MPIEQETQPAFYVKCNICEKYLEQKDSIFLKKFNTSDEARKDAAERNWYVDKSNTVCPRCWEKLHIAYIGGLNGDA
jgi:hypothetical protein